MAQPPFKTDVLQIDPSATGTRTISRDTTTNELKFVDPTFPSGVKLSDLVGLQTITATTVVGTGGGATYTTIQSAIDALPTTGSYTNPQVILLFPGTYTEKLTIDKDGVVLVGQGEVRIVNTDTDPTIHITQGETTIPKFVRLINLTIAAEDDGAACVFVDGSNTYATGTLTVVTAPLVAGDTITIGGSTLTAVAGGRTSGSNDFDCTLGTTAALAAEIVAAINDASNSFVSIVSASLDGSDVDLTAITQGEDGNTVTLVVNTVPAGGITTSGATLSGGGGLDSEVGLDGVSIEGCRIQAMGIGTRQLVCDTVNTVTVSGGTWDGSSSTSIAVIGQTATFSIFGVQWINNIEVAYDTGLDQPANAPTGWEMQNVGAVGTVLLNLVGAGETLIANCPIIGHTTHNGDRTFRAVNAGFGDVLIEDTVAATFVHCTHGTVGGAGAGTLQENAMVGSVTFNASTSETVTFWVAQPDTQYQVMLDIPSLGVAGAVTSRTTSNFTIETSVAFTGNIGYTILRQLN